jgi:hypothetical protein
MSVLIRTWMRAAQAASHIGGLPVSAGVLGDGSAGVVSVELGPVGAGSPLPLSLVVVPVGMVGSGIVGTAGPLVVAGGVVVGSAGSACAGRAVRINPAATAAGMPSRCHLVT